MTGVPVVVATSTRPADPRRLTASERQRLRGLTRPARHSEWLRSRRALRALLDAAQLPRDSTRYGFPNRRLSLTHSDGLAAAAMVIGPAPITGIGIDIESVIRPVTTAAARFYLSDAERSNLTPYEQMRLWTVKEAIFKSDPGNDGAMLADYVLDQPAALSGIARRREQPSVDFAYRSICVAGFHMTVAVSFAGYISYPRSFAPMPIVTYDTVAERVQALLGVPIDALEPDSILRDLVDDSYELIEVIVDVQEEYDVIFAQEDLEKVETMADLVALLQEKEQELLDRDGGNDATQVP